MLFIKRVFYRHCPWNGIEKGWNIRAIYVCMELRMINYFCGIIHCLQSSISCWKRSICSVVSNSSYFFWIAAFARFNTSSGSALGAREFLENEHKNLLLFLLSNIISMVVHSSFVVEMQCKLQWKERIGWTMAWK